MKNENSERKKFRGGQRESMPFRKKRRFKKNESRDEKRFQSRNRKGRAESSPEDEARRSGSGKKPGFKKKFRKENSGNRFDKKRNSFQDKRARGNDRKSDERKKFYHDRDEKKKSFPRYEKRSDSETFPRRSRDKFRKYSNDKRTKTFRPEKKHSGEKIISGGSAALIRLNRYISNSGICSRREADELITAGVISVNGEVVTKLGTKISVSDTVKYNNETIKREKKVYVLLNKPKDFITTTDDPEKRNTVMQLVEGACSERIYPVGRLDRNTTGVLLFTNDGTLTKKLTHPSSNIRKIYHAELDKKLAYPDLQKITEGVELEDGKAQVDEIAYDHPSDKSHVGIELHSGKNRVVRRIFESLGYEVRKLDRVYFAGLTKKDLPRGRWRFLSKMEINNLKMMAGVVKNPEDAEIVSEAEE